jgi:large subunit ribosomal protein L29
MTGKEVRALSDEEIGAEIGRLRAKIVELRGQSVTEKVEDNSQFTKVRRDIARLQTERTARRHGASAPAAGPAVDASEKPVKKKTARKTTKKKAAARPAAKKAATTAKKPARKPARKSARSKS